MYTLYVFDIRPKVSRMIDFILKHYTAHFIGQDEGVLYAIRGFVEEVGLEGACDDGELKVSTRFHVFITDCVTPHFEGVEGHVIFGGGFFVFTVKGLVEAVSPGVAVVEIKGARDGEVVVCCGGVGVVTHEGVDVCFVGVC